MERKDIEPEPGGGRKKLKPEYDAGKNLKEQMDAAVALYDCEIALSQSIADALASKPYQGDESCSSRQVCMNLKWRRRCKLPFKNTVKHKTIKPPSSQPQMPSNFPKPLLPRTCLIKKGVYFQSTAEKEKISVGAERQRRYRAMKRWRANPTEENFWGVVLVYAGVKFKTYSGLPFTYEVRKGRSGEYTKELWINRREKSKSLAWSSIVLALKNIKGEVVDRPKALGDIRGVTYIYGMFYRFGLIDVPDKVKEKMGRPKDRKK